MRVCNFGLAAILAGLCATSVSATTITADTVLEFFDSGAGPLPGPFGADTSGSFPVPVDLSVVTDGNPVSALSLPTGSFVTLGFSTGFIFDGPGDDIFVSEPGAASELADVFVSSDFGATFSFIGQADGGTLTGIDLATSGFTGNVNAIKIVGLDNLGGSPGFDVAFVQGLEGSVVEEPQGPTPSAVPLPASGLLLLAGLAGLGFSRRKSV